jgi:hypothetical protein
MKTFKKRLSAWLQRDSNWYEKGLTICRRTTLPTNTMFYHTGKICIAVQTLSQWS